MSILYTLITWCHDCAAPCSFLTQKTIDQPYYAGHSLFNVSKYYANSLINQEIKALIKKKYLLQSLLICLDFNVTFTKFSGVDTPGTPSKNGPTGGRQATRVRLLRYSNIPPLNFSVLTSNGY